MYPRMRSIRGLAYRRHHAARMKSRAYVIMNRYRLSFASDGEKKRRELAAKTANHLSKCSCWMCGNPRRHRGEPGISERRNDLADWDDME